MKIFDVYPIFDIEPVKASGSYLWDKSGVQYLDLYGGHAVISVGHSHPYYVAKITEQLNKIGFYSNSIKISLQEELAEKLGKLSGCENYSLFLCNSGAEANENALKLASFENGRKKVVAIKKAFHGRTSLAVAATDDKSIVSPINEKSDVVFVGMNDESAIESAIDKTTCAVIIEGIQGVGGVKVPADSFLKKIKLLCEKNNAILILDEVQSGYGRSGKFFAHQYSEIKPDIITVAKGMGNGFPVAGVLISEKFNAKHGVLGTTFGGNHLACTAAIAVLDIIKNEKLVDNAIEMGKYITTEISSIKEIKEIRGKGLMLGIELNFNCNELRKQLLFEHNIFTGSASDKNTIRILPALNIRKTDIDVFIEAFSKVLTNQKQYT
jgi:acetylornithine aminotransferase